MQARSHSFSDILAYIIAHEFFVLGIAFGGLLLIGIVSMTFVLFEQKRRPVHAFEFAHRNEKLDASWRRVWRLLGQGRFVAAFGLALGAFISEYRSLKQLSTMGKLDFLFVLAGSRLAIAAVGVDTLALIVRVWDFVERR